jgi:hypothetical protein
MNPQRRMILAGIHVAFAASLAVACNSTTTANRTIPPIAGLTVGGPTAQGGAGSVSSSVDATAAGLISGTPIKVHNVSRNIDGATVSAPSSGVVIVTVAGDVGDTLRFTLSPVSTGELSREYSVPSPTLHNVQTEGQQPGHVLRGHNATITGEGFCAEPSNNRIFIDGNDQGGGAAQQVTPGSLVFLVPADLNTAGGFTHSIQVAIDGAADSDLVYSSHTFEVTIDPQI